MGRGKCVTDCFAKMGESYTLLNIGVNESESRKKVKNKKEKNKGLNSIKGINLRQ